MQLAPLVPKPKPQLLGNHEVQRKPKGVGLASVPEPETDESESFADELRDGNVDSVSMLAEHRRPQSVAQRHGWVRELESNAVARRIHARAFTSGQHIFFGPGEHRPHPAERSSQLAIGPGQFLRVLNDANPEELIY